VFPHTNPAGEIVNLYGRAVGDRVPKSLRHDHLPGRRGVFNAKALAADTVFLCEGPLDALSLIVAGHSNSCAIFGKDGLPWAWVKARRLVFCFDRDKAGQRWRDLAWEGRRRGKDVYFLPDSAYAGCNDLNETWMATGQLDVGKWQDGPSGSPGDKGALSSRWVTLLQQELGQAASLDAMSEEQLEDLSEYLEDRAANREYCGEQDREEAERDAIGDLARATTTETNARS